mmetsp:Transcript_43618/g.123417  ORF Transcript_43618/g.123417 Transcript_43618/m.123417 type:complete len:873 (-) Transcript_43618:194-2812(-)
MEIDEDFEGELEGLDITACKTKITLLQAQRERRREATERLQEKLKALNYELAARKEEAETQRKRVADEMEMNKRHAEQQRARTGGQDSGAIVPAGGAFSDLETDQVRRFVEQHLSNALVHRAPRNELGIRLFEERDLMVEKPIHAGSSEGMSVDTVLITHWRSASSELKFHLSYRVGRDTTAKKLREDACLYWGISEVEYILWTKNNCKVSDDLLIQNCFKPNEEAHLILAPKTPKKVEPPERVSDLIRARAGPKARQVGRKKVANNAAQNVDVVAKADFERQGGSFYDDMSKLTGLFEFMTQRDRNNMAHIKRIRCGAFCLYFFLTMLTLVSFNFVKPPDKEYFCRLGVYQALSDTGPQLFNQIRSPPEVWTWLETAIPEQVFINTSSLRQSNLLAGTLRIWMQQVKDESAEACQEDVPTTSGIKCLSEDYNENTAGTEDLKAVKAFWDNGTAESATLNGADGRSNNTFPYKFLTDAEGLAKGTFSESATLSSYDASGYLLAYETQFVNLTDSYDAYLADMKALRKAGWISKRTRALHVSLAVYNPNFDYWVTSWFMLEFPVTGIVYPHSDVDLYRPVYDHATKVGLPILSLDVCRFILIGFVLFYEVTWQAKFKTSKLNSEDKKKPGCCMSLLYYSFSWRGILDLGAISCFFAVFCVRYLSGPLNSFTGKLQTEYLNALQAVASKTMMDWYRDHMITEAVLFGLLAMRLLSCFQLNRNMYVLWKTCAVAASRYARFCLVLIPCIGGFVLLVQSFSRAYSMQYRTFWSSLTSVLMGLLGDTGALTHDAATRPITTVYLFSFYMIISLLCVNTWIAVLVQEYQKVRVASGYRCKDYRWKEYDYITWFVFPLMKKGYLKLRPSIRPNVEEDEV